MEPVVVYRDRWLVVVDKPSGLPTQATRGGEPGVFEWLKGREQEVFLHHRLDRPASGLVLFALHGAANKGLAKAFRSRTIGRTYHAVLYGDAQSGSWEAPVENKAALTQVEVVGRGAGLTAVRVQLRTGRKHQIRVHAAMRGVPVIGDRRYGGEAGRAWPRLALHACRLVFEHPVTGDRVDLAASIPDDLQTVWARAGG